MLRHLKGWINRYSFIKIITKGNVMSFQRRLIPSTSMLLAFDAAARTGSFTAAARELSLTQGAISYQVGRLEASLEISLFQRKVRQVTLTSAGQSLFRTTHRLFRELEDEIHELAGQSFNVGSPAQVGEILFEKMELPGGKKGKTGKYSTPADVLEDLATEHALPGRVLDWRQLQKLKSTYTDAL